MLVREAGGWTNDFLTDNGLTQGNPILACTPEIAERIANAASLRDLWTGG